MYCRMGGNKKIIFIQYRAA
uniref:Uncharacterized protein n=1 Tax=Anguilla anguilla TaxID=7936 RepID=A0A0E9QWQ3_ANGAN